MNKTIENFLILRSGVRMAHHIPGRIRLKYKLGIITQLAGFNSKNLEKEIGKFPALKSYKLTPSTGSILIEYDATLVDPSNIEALFSQDDTTAKKAYYRIAELLNH